MDTMGYVSKTKQKLLHLTTPKVTKTLLYFPYVLHHSCASPASTPSKRKEKFCIKKKHAFAVYTIEYYKAVMKPFIPLQYGWNWRELC